MTRDYAALICSVLSLIAMVFSWITMAKQDWRYYIVTVLCAVSCLGLAAYALAFL